LGFCCEIGHLGDSRIFLLGDWGIAQLTEDHAVHYIPKTVQVVGGANAASAPRPRSRCYLSRYLGQIGPIHPLVVNFRPTPGDKILICSDGISGSISKEEIHAIVNSNESGAKSIQSLIATAESRGGSDNQTAVLIYCLAGKAGSQLRPAS
jgi:protein phosphatase